MNLTSSEWAAPNQDQVVLWCVVVQAMAGGGKVRASAGQNWTDSDARGIYHHCVGAIVVCKTFLH